MGRVENRMKKRSEKNPIEECNRIQQTYYPELFEKFKQALDPRHQSYIDYSIEVMLGTLYYKNIAGISSMRGMTDAFNEDAVVENISRYLHVEGIDFLPHGQTLNEFLERLDPSVLEETRKDMVNKLIRKKTFNDARFQG
ncbi:MAG: transposase family protein [Lachnospiraceae bacterium]|nr:transposase family protein [Lachnospiraceae bacterium]